MSPITGPRSGSATDKELGDNSAVVARLLKLAEDAPLTPVFAARDRSRNAAVVLREVLPEGSGNAP